MGAHTPTLSFEFFPPKTSKGSELLWEQLGKLLEFTPSCMTVTCSSNGSSSEKTLDTIQEFQNRTDTPIAMHLTYIDTTRKELYQLADTLWKKNIKHIVALRGDLPEDLNWPLDNDKNYFQYTSHFVAALKACQDFEIFVGAYPEKHPDAVSLKDDIEALKKKCDAGADRAITQFFFDNDVFLRFRDTCNKANIQLPISPGLLPIHNFKTMQDFATRCRTNVPDWLHEKFEGLENKPDEAKSIAIDLLRNQSVELAAEGVDHFHFYTLNKASITQESCTALLNLNQTEKTA